MRVCLVSHGFPPYETTGVENYSEALARALSRAGHTVEVFAPRKRAELAELSVRRSEHPGYAVTFVTRNSAPRDAGEALEPPGLARTFGAFLDRERPELVHFQHVLKLGVGLIEEAQKRDIPTVYTAHDYYAVCHRYTLLRPDLARCTTLGQPAACARCDLALSYLNEQEGLGDYQAGAAPEQLSPEQAERLQALLEGEPPAEFESALEQRSALDGVRAAAFARLDRIVAPTRFLAERLAEGGVEPERIVHLPYGIEVDELAALPRPVRAADEPLRVAYLGGLSKQKGVEVLLDAWGRLRPDGAAELSIWGGGTDRVWVERLRAQAEEVGAQWRGAYDREGLVRALGEAHVLVVPSVWVENYPIVIREALAAGRPVLASELGALPESVRHGVDGLLFAPGDAEALSAALRRLLDEPELYPALCDAIEPVHGIDAQVGELAALYERVRVEHREERPDLPPSLREFQARKAELDHLPLRALFARALDGLGELRSRLGGEIAALAPEELLRTALTNHTRAKVLLRDHQDESRWLKHNSEGVRERNAWLEGVIADRDAAVESMQAEVLEVQRGRDSLAEEAQWLHGVVAGKDEEIAELRARVLEAEMEREALRIDLASSTRVMNEERQRLLEELGQAAELGVEALAAQERLLRQEIEPLMGIMERIDPPDAEPAEAEDSFDQSLRSLVRALRGTVERLEFVQEELAWRRAQMAQAAELSARKPASFLIERTGLGRMARGWRSIGEEQGE